MNLNIDEIPSEYHSKLKPYVAKDGTIKYNIVVCSSDDPELIKLLDVYVSNKIYRDLKS